MSLGCPKALVDSEHIVGLLQQAGYDVADAEDPSAVTVINTCGFIDAAKQESFDAIESALSANSKVVVTGCLGANEAELRSRFPQLEHISGPASTDAVLDAVQTYIPNPQAASLLDSNQLAPSKPTPTTTRGPKIEGLSRLARTQLTPPHYAYLKVSEGCNHTCSFCIIPDMRGKLVSRPIGDVLAQATQLVEQGVQELMVIAQDLSAYGVDVRYQPGVFNGKSVPTNLYSLCEQLGEIAPWVRLHYVYPYPHVDKIIPLMADGVVLPYLDMPLQHASPRILKAMRRPAATQKMLRRIDYWRSRCPDLTLRSTFIVGFPGETDEDFGMLLDFLHEAQFDRTGCFTYSAVAGAAANELSGEVDERDKLDRYEVFYEHQAQISEQRLSRHVGRRLRVLLDEIEFANTPQAQAGGRTMFDAPQIDGMVHVTGTQHAQVGEFGWVEIEGHDEHDLFGKWLGNEVLIS